MPEPSMEHAPVDEEAHEPQGSECKYLDYSHSSSRFSVRAICRRVSTFDVPPSQW